MGCNVFKAQMVIFKENIKTAAILERLLFEKAFFTIEVHGENERVIPLQ